MKLRLPLSLQALVVWRGGWGGNLHLLRSKFSFCFFFAKIIEGEKDSHQQWNKSFEIIFYLFFFYYPFVTFPMKALYTFSQTLFHRNVLKHRYTCMAFPGYLFIHKWNLFMHIILLLHITFTFFICILLLLYIYIMDITLDQ